jgi:hypothetical protein
MAGAAPDPINAPINPPTIAFHNFLLKKLDF